MGNQSSHVDDEKTKKQKQINIERAEMEYYNPVNPVNNPVDPVKTKDQNNNVELVVETVETVETVQKAVWPELVRLPVSEARDAIMEECQDCPVRITVVQNEDKRIHPFGYRR